MYGNEYLVFICKDSEAQKCMVINFVTMYAYVLCLSLLLLATPAIKLMPRFKLFNESVRHAGFDTMTKKLERAITLQYR